MTLWVDADACPNRIKTIIFRAAQRTKVAAVLVANQHIQVPADPHIRAIRVESGADKADMEIIRRLQAGDLVITQDIPLADEAITLGAQVLSPRGERLTRENIKARLNMRDFFETLRASGINSGGPAALSNTDCQMFANQLDRYLTRSIRNSQC